MTYDQAIETMNQSRVRLRCEILSLVGSTAFVDIERYDNWLNRHPKFRGIKAQVEMFEVMRTLAHDIDPLFYDHYEMADKTQWVLAELDRFPFDFDSFDNTKWKIIVPMCQHLWGKLNGN